MGPKTVRRWVVLAGRCLQACAEGSVAAQLFHKAGYDAKALTRGPSGSAWKQNDDDDDHAGGWDE